MDNDFFRYIEQPTAPVAVGGAPSGFSLSESDFDTGSLAPAASGPEEERVRVDAEFTSRFIISFFDGVQEPLFYHLNESRRRRRYFGSREKYVEAVELSHSSDDELRRRFPDAADEKIELVARLKKFNGRMEKLEKELPFTLAEKETLRAPLKKLVEKSNFDIPPGIAMLMAVCEVMSSRLICLYAD
jgi:hypothetical protein